MILKSSVLGYSRVSCVGLCRFSLNKRLVSSTRVLFDINSLEDIISQIEKRKINTPKQQQQQQKQQQQQFPQQPPSLNALHLDTRKKFHPTKDSYVKSSSRFADNTEYYGKRNNNKLNKKEIFQFTTGSERAIEAVKVIIKAVRRVNSRGKILTIVPGKGIQQSTILKLVQTLNLDEEGLQIVDKREHNGELLPLIKKIDQEAALKVYSDYLHELRTKEMALSKPNQYSNKQNLTKDHSIKIIKINWNISTNDLEEKGFKVNIFIGNRRDLRKSESFEKLLTKAEKENFDQNNKDEENDDNDNEIPINFSKKLSDLEIIRREKLIETVKIFVEEYSIKNNLSIEGDINDKFVLKLKGKEKEINKEELKELKNKKKQERAEKLRLKTELKKQKLFEAQKEITV
ncbi:hypothetical protein PACTADRAFT_35169 [Pachysolen tannophilus NRRL Y-2460]|uniref:Altered inheritance of mitochondria protein 23, mitochondrial n=1 Tax=Pachysolen tannophilus NRRL Y-2460 TaxID=669874 RepID=A0A1E4TRK9_PACTA|nr:hypothetical protein PACTADRAFT_35169 [Pachysolen tannophilus NRRL Y-2460]